ncbi:MarR family winged helix-turn-helix transcriptional regulator [Salinibacterium sp. SYSU T00001]|uniref:MarR family winged helix-turn-helix transcriptional regulator n=1 Tax=Homoserinimonas sedimenticola TaxID=2986805 RepID=UPI002235D9B0|nr:MarR family winged helix-turn-helix transcriptional regulator [Salinibacterium sedimenticola]MCW4386027.1 MarR family winged helix-turn-helix transcriptional regulator [Salinibacterium sedimenticola]
MLSPELSESTGFLVRRVQHLHSQLWLHGGDSDVSPVQFGVLSLLETNPGVDQRELGDILELDRSTVTEIVTRMERRNYLKRTRDDADRRRKILTLTDQGRRLLVELRPHANKVAAAFVGHLRQADREELNRLLRLVLEGGRAETSEDSAVLSPPLNGSRAEGPKSSG